MDGGFFIEPDIEIAKPSADAGYLIRVWQSRTGPERAKEEG
jgi:hypothetical protein